MRITEALLMFRFVVAIFETIVGHSGYNFPYLPSSPKFHDYHHEKYSKPVLGNLAFLKLRSLITASK